MAHVQWGVKDNDRRQIGDGGGGFGPWRRRDGAGSGACRERKPKVPSAPVQTHPSQGEVQTVAGARAELVTTEDGAFASFSTKGLEPGHAHTMWFVTINDPAACETSPCKSPDVMERTEMTKADVGYGDGLIVGADGAATFAARVPVGELRQAWFGNGYRNAQEAEIHLAIADHGPVVPDMVDSMIGSYRGGCTDESLPEGVPDTARADGTPGPNTCRMVQFAVLVQGEEMMAKTQ